MPETDPRKLRSSFFSRLKHGSNGRPLIEAQTAWPRICSVLPGKPHVTNRTGAAELHRPGRPHVLEDPARAARAVEACEREHLAGYEFARLFGSHHARPLAGTITAPAATAPNTKRASMLKLRLHPAAGDGLMPLYPLLTILTVATLEQLGW